MNQRLVKSAPEAGDSSLFRNPPPEISDHPLFRGGTTVGLMTAEAPRFESAPGGNAALSAELTKMGVKHELTHGSYGGPENSFIIYGLLREQLYSLGHKYGQEAVVHSQDGQHELLYTHGPKAGKFHPSLPTVNYSAKTPDDYYTALPGRGHVTLHFDFDKLHDSPVQHTMPLAQQAPANDRPVTKAEIASRLVTLLRKSAGLHPWVGHYPWHEGHTSHHRRSIGHGLLLTGAEAQALTPLAKSAGAMPADEAGGSGVGTYAKHAVPFGTISSGPSSGLKHYPLNGAGAAVNQLVADHGMQVHYVGGKHGRAPLSEKNYDTGHLLVWDPTDGAGGDPGHADYADSWRKLHELAHALTLPEVNKIYGEGRRVGALGERRTTREALRAVHWEHLAAGKQRELAAQIGARISDEDFNREHNTVMHDAIHRAITGASADPAMQGFVPNAHQVPLETSLGIVREAAAQKGLQHANETLRKFASDLAGVLRGALKKNGF